ncbi:MAG: class D sortase [Acidobacteria bacterium]|nr:class D sortase [Acidobacteriota bacterium]
MTPSLRRGTRWLSWLLIGAGLLGLGYVAGSLVQMMIVQARERQAFEARRAAAATAPLPRALPGDPEPRPVAAAGPGTEAAPRPATGATIGLVRIERLGLDVVVKEGVDDATLKVAAGHIPGTDLPGSGAPGENVALAAHRDTLFRPLRGVRLGDRIQLDTDAGRFDYDVDATAVVEPTEVSVLAGRDVPTLTLVTCWPFDFRGAAPKRFVVHARQVAAAPGSRSYTPSIPKTEEAP